MNKAMIKMWMQERDEVMKSCDVLRFKVFYYKWMSKGFYSEPLPSDEVIAVAMHKALYHMKSATDKERLAAEYWLIEHGYTTNMG